MNDEQVAARTLEGSRVCMLVRNTFDHDSRVQREALALARRGAAVTVVAYASSSKPEGTTSFTDRVDLVRVRSQDADVFAPVWRLLERLHLAQRSTDATRFRGDDHETTSPTASPSRGASAEALRPVLLAVLRTLARIVAKPLLLVSTYRVNGRIARAVRSAEYDVIHAHDWNTLWLGHRLATEKQARLVYDSHELAAHRALAGWGSIPHHRGGWR